MKKKKKERIKKLWKWPVNYENEKKRKKKSSENEQSTGLFQSFFSFFSIPQLKFDKKFL